MSALDQRIASLRTGLAFASKAHRPVIQAMIDQLLQSRANAGEAVIDCPGSDTAGEAAPQNLVPAARSDSRSGPEGGSDNAREPHACEPPQSGTAPQADAAEVTAGRDRQPDTGTAAGALYVPGAAGSLAPCALSPGGGMPDPDPIPRAARDVAPGEPWCFPEHRSLAELLSAAELDDPPFELRPCAHCDKPMPARSGETSAQYQKRDYCNAHCRRDAEISRAKARRTAERGARRIALPRAAEEDAIARFIAERGVTKLPPAFVAPSPQGALPEGAARAVVAAFAAPEENGIVAVVAELRRAGRRVLWGQAGFKIDGLACFRSDLYRAANQLRAERGLPPRRLPNALAGAA